MNEDSQGMKIEAEHVLSGLRSRLSTEIQNNITMEVILSMKDVEIKELKEELEELREVVTELKSKG